MHFPETEHLGNMGLGYLEILLMKCLFKSFACFSIECLPFIDLQQLFAYVGYKSFVSYMWQMPWLTLWTHGF